MIFFQKTNSSYYYIQPTSDKALRTSYGQGGYSFYISRNQSMTSNFLDFFESDCLINSFVSLNNFFLNDIKFKRLA